MEQPRRVTHLADDPAEPFRRAGEKLCEQSGDRFRAGADGDEPFTAVPAEQGGDLREPGLFEHPHDRRAEFSAAEDRFGAVAVEQRIFDREGDVFGHVAGVAQTRRQEAVDESGLQLHRVEGDTAAVEFLNLNEFFRQFHHTYNIVRLAGGCKLIFPGEERIFLPELRKKFSGAFDISRA